jgi:hypothetical protein
VGLLMSGSTFQVRSLHVIKGVTLSGPSARVLLAHVEAASARVLAPAG